MVKRKYLIRIIIFSILLSIFLIIKYLNTFSNIELNTAIIMGVMINLLVIIDYYILDKGFKSPYLLFQLLSIPFLYGQLVSRFIFGYIPKNYFDLYPYVSINGLKQSCLLIIICQLSMHIGVILLKIFYRDKDNTNVNPIRYNKKALNVSGILLFLISVIPAFIDYFKKLKYASIGGYLEIISNSSYGFSSLFEKIAPFFFISLLMLLYANKDIKIKRVLILIFIISFYGSQIFLGARGIPLLIIVSTIWFYHYYINRINKKQFIIIMIVVYFLISLLNVIRESREKSTAKWMGNIGSLIVHNITDNNAILQLNYEVGTTIYPIAYVVESVPNTIPYRNGASYLWSVITVVTVNSNGAQKSSVAYKSDIPTQIGRLSGIAFGGSFIEEAYVNFGWKCFIIMILLGAFLEKIYLMCKNNSIEIRIVLLTYLISQLLWTIRNSFSPIPRAIFWYILFSYIVFTVIRKKYIKFDNSYK